MEELVLRAQGCDLAKTLSCGQAFRWQEKDGWWQGVVRDRPVRIRPEGKRLVLCAPPKERAFWRRYFSLDRDYGEMEALLAVDPKTARCLPYSKGIRILRQEPWEALCSFLISQCNNIPRIRQIVSALCALFGEDVGGGFAFPAPERLAALDEAALAPVRAGYRAAYLIAAARAVSSGTLQLLLKMTARDPGDRFRTWDDLLDAISYAEATRQLENRPAVSRTAVSEKSALRLKSRINS